MSERSFARTSLGPVIVLGVGLGGFVDGIVLHQLLHWHHLLSATGASLHANMVADGLFHAATWLVTLGGLVWLWAYLRGGRVNLSWSALAAGLILGWGLFNIVEGVIDHQLLGIHHVREGRHELVYDIGFLAFGALLVVTGWLISRTNRDERANARRTPHARG
jgi:uncharacterized membrane protein